MMRTFKDQRERENEMIREDRREWLTEACKHFFNASEMSSALGMDLGYLCKIAKDAGISLPKGSAQHTRRKEYEALAAEGLTGPQVAERLGVTLGTVHCAASKYGIRFADARAKAKIAPKPAPAQEPVPADPLAAMRALAAKENAAMRKRGSV